MVEKGEKRLIQSVERAYNILKCFEKEESLRITDISKMLSLHKSTTFGLVSTLEELNLLEQDKKTGLYKLGAELFKLGAHVNVSLRNIVSPYIDKLVEECQETVNLVARKDDSIIYIQKKESPHSMRICTELGLELPLYCTAAGKAILAELNNDEIDEILNRTKFRKFTNNTLVNIDEIKIELDQARVAGYAIDHEELEYGLTCVGISIVNRQNVPIGGMSVSGPTSRMDYRMTRKIAKLLVDYKNRIKADL